MFEKILVAVGGDDESLEPVRMAARLATRLGAQLTIVTVRRATTIGLGDVYYAESANDSVAQAEMILEAACRTAQQHGAQPVGAECLEGSPVERIVEFARHGAFGMIVMGTRRRGRLQAALLGSVSAGVAAHSLCPVLVVPDAVAEAEKEEARVRQLGYAPG
jgi:nucleotide-binding universal stress UspA family protein